jgi:hypothetical protein
MQKIQLTLTDQEADILKAHAGRLGYKLPRYVKHLITEAVLSQSYRIADVPLFEPSKQTLRAVRQAGKDYKEGKTIRIKKSVKELLG